MAGYLGYKSSSGYYGPVFVVLHIHFSTICLERLEVKCGSALIRLAWIYL